MNFFDPHDHRLYLAADERATFLEAAKTLPREVRTLCHVLHDTGCRLSEALALPMRGVDLAGKFIVLKPSRSESVRRAAEKGCEALDVADIVASRLLDEVAHRHVFDHATAHQGAPVSR